MQQYYVLNGEQQIGPFSVEEIGKKLAAGEFSGEQLAWHEGLPEWLPLNQIWRQASTSTPPPLPPYESPAPALEPVASKEPKALAWFDNNVVVVLAFLFCLPLGFIPLWLSKRYSRNVKFVASACIAILSLLALRGLVSAPWSETKRETKSVNIRSEDSAPTSTVSSQRKPPIERKLAFLEFGIDAGKDSPKAAQYKELLSILARHFEISEDEVGNMTYSAVKSLKADYGLNTTTLEMLSAVRKVAQGEGGNMLGKGRDNYASALAALSVLMTTSH